MLKPQPRERGRRPDDSVTVNFALSSPSVSERWMLFSAIYKKNGRERKRRMTEGSSASEIRLGPRFDTSGGRLARERNYIPDG